MRKNIHTLIAGLMLAAGLGNELHAQQRITGVKPKEHNIARYGVQTNLNLMLKDFKPENSESPLIIVVPYDGKVDYPANPGSNTTWNVDYQFRPGKLPEVLNISFSTNSTATNLTSSKQKNSIDVLVSPVTLERNGTEYIVTSNGSSKGKSGNSFPFNGSASGTYAPVVARQTISVDEKMNPIGRDTAYVPNTNRFTGVLFIYNLNQIQK